MGAVHFATARNPLFPPAMFTDRNFLGGLVFTFIMGMTMMSVMALLPSLLQTIYGYPVIDAGLLLAPRGVGTLVFITLFSRLMAKSDPRLMLACGFGITGFSFWLMTGWSVTMPTWPMVLSGFIQGMGISLVFIPANLITFATLPPAYRTDASGLVNMMRNLGASIGIAMATFLLSRSVQVNHAELGAEVTRMSVPFDLDRITAYGDASAAMVAAADGMINRQAAMIAYINDFLLMAIVSFAAIPLILFLKSAKSPLPAAKAAVGGAPEGMAEALH
jgi:DHA2 family multidrug resistance protein